jgi:hypothetical protein
MGGRYSRKPYQHPLQVSAIGKRIKAHKIDAWALYDTGGYQLDSSYILLHPYEVMAIFPSFEEGVERCAKARKTWDETEDAIRARVAQTDAYVLTILRGEV